MLKKIKNVKEIDLRIYLIAVFFIPLILFIIFTPEYRYRQIATGDEPHYLLTTHSILKDKDIDLKNNYDNKDYLRFYPTDLPDRHIIKKDGKEFPKKLLNF